MANLLDRDTAIRWMNSLNNSSNIVSQLIDKWADIEEVKKDVLAFANWFFTLKPDEGEMSPLVKKVSECKSKEELEGIQAEIVASKNVEAIREWNAKMIEVCQ